MNFGGSTMRDLQAISTQQPPALLTQRAAALSGRSPAAIRQLVRAGVLRGEIPAGYESRQFIERESLERLIHRKVTFEAWLAVEQRDVDRQRADHRDRAKRSQPQLTPWPASAVNTDIVVTAPSFGSGNTKAQAIAHGF